jgi:hypothetical protein
MFVYRGPSSKRLSDESHQRVSRVSPEALSIGILTDAPIQFDISKSEESGRRSTCSLYIEKEDLFPILEAIICRLKEDQATLKRGKAEAENRATKNSTKLDKVRDIVGNTELSPEQMVEEVRTAARRY